VYIQYNKICSFVFFGKICPRFSSIVRERLGNAAQGEDFKELIAA
jgi:hypothetical protein